MTSKASSSDDLRMIKKALPKSALLRDYLLDDISSCSSNGFRSYPRRQCCTTVRLLVELDLNKNGKLPTKRQTKSKSRPKQRSVLQRASAVMINAFKHFPFTGVVNSMKVDFVRSSRSRKLFKRGFWKKTDHHINNVKQLKLFGDLIKEKETETTPPNHKNSIKQLKSFGDLLKEKEKEKETETTPPPSPPQSSTATAATAELNISTSSSNNSLDGEFTATTDSFTTGHSSSETNSSQNDVMDDLEENKQMTNKKRVGTTTATAANYSATTDNTENKWQNEHGEQLSPVSVMDFPCDDDNDADEASSVFQPRILDVKEPKKPMQKARRFEGARQFEPVKLEDRITQMTLAESSVEKRAATLLHVMTVTTPCHHLFKFEATKSLLLGFFKEKMIEENVSDFEMLQTTTDWIDGQTEEMFLDWDSRKAYVREIDKMVKWSKYGDEAEKENVGLELEHAIFSSLVDDVFDLQD